MTMPKFEPVCYWVKDAEQFHIGTKPFSMAWKPLHSSGQLAEAYEAGKREASSKWQPIETAPKDGVAFRAYADELIDLDFNPCGSVEAAWNGEEFIGCVWNGQQDAWYGKAINPTHWMPLPAAQINHLQMALADTEALEAETSARCLKQAAQIEMMREFIARAPVSSGVCCCGEAIDGHSSPMSCGHSPVDLWDHSVEQILSTTPDQALEQFAAKVREQCEKACESEYVTEVDADDAVYNSAITHALRAIRAFTEIPK